MFLKINLNNYMLYAMLVLILSMKLIEKYFVIHIDVYVRQ
jgi:hypothetical protein